MMGNLKMNKDGNFSQKGVPIHSQVRKIKQESEKILDLDWSPVKPEIRPVLRELSRQISRSPLGISGRPISVVQLVGLGELFFQSFSILNGSVS
ncbi:hypothetical protein VNO77_33199 [Canavalia gladiata]|uniref:Uncharacterized protein n=1 Tax=Canavalia gladiata TaxID=3824 RepID=A0AAN9PY51_CANGL